MLTLLGTDRDGNTDQELQQALQHADQLKAALVGAEKAGLDLKSQWLKQHNKDRESAGKETAADAAGE